MPSNTQLQEPSVDSNPVSVSTGENVTQLKSIETSERSTPKEKSEATKPKSKRQPRKRLSRTEQIEKQANPKTVLAGKQKTFTLKIEYCSDILHEHLQLNQSTMLAAYERLAGLLRLVANDNASYQHVNAWIATNLKLCQAQVETMQAQRDTLSEDCIDEMESLDITIPDDYHTQFEVSHPIGHKMIAVLKLVDNELSASEELFMAGIIDDASYNSLRTQAQSIIRGSVDRIYKATSPGMRNGGRFTPQQLAGWIRNGNRMLFSDIPKGYEHIVQPIEEKE